MHYGVPPDVSLLDDRFVDRFARFGKTVPFGVKCCIHTQYSIALDTEWS